MNLALRAVAVAGLALAGCSSLISGKHQPFTLYAPSYSGAEATRQGAKVHWQLLVETPQASDALNTARMLAMPSPGVIEVFPGARWRDPAPAMLRDILVQAFEESGRILGVGGSASGLRGDFALSLELRAFQVDYAGGAPQARVGFQARLLDYTSNRVLDARSFSASAPVAGREAADAFAGFQAALNEVVPEVVDWTLKQGDLAREKSRQAVSAAAE
ncbi:MAG: membrane integrity-associated transporter subunit PqiC [Xanthomonadales bacterium]|nr:membrane integrity-associated transporter subunit PqiC [Xanthomonadales bacterium]